MTDPQPDFDPEFRPAPLALFAFAAFGALFVLHCIALSALTSNLDEIKHVTLWSGGGLVLTFWPLLAWKRLVPVPPRRIFVAWGVWLLALTASTVFGAADYAR